MIALVFLNKKERERAGKEREKRDKRTELVRDLGIRVGNLRSDTCDYGRVSLSNKRASIGSTDLLSSDRRFSIIFKGAAIRPDVVLKELFKELGRIDLSKGLH